MKIAVMATGGVGGVFGAKFAEAGEDITFIARGTHLEEIKKNGLTILDDKGEVNIKDIQITDDPVSIGTVDFIIFAVKLWDTESAATICKPMLGPETVLIPFQNGVSSTETISKIIGETHTGRGISRVSASIEAPGIIRRVGSYGSLAFAEAGGAKSTRMQAFLDICNRAGVEAEIPNDIFLTLWQKYIFLVTVSGMTTAARRPMQSLIKGPEGLTTAINCMTEVAEVGRAIGIHLPTDTVEKLVNFLKKMPQNMKASQAIDLENGRRLEAPWLTGNVCKMGRKYGIPTPANDTLYSVIQPYIMGERGNS